MSSVIFPSKQTLSLEDEQLLLIVEGIKQIEAILKAEQKRREESNNMTQDYIQQYLDKLESTLQQKIAN